MTRKPVKKITAPPGTNGEDEPARPSDSSSPADVAALAHELRTPLAAIITIAEMLERQTLGPLGDPRYLGYARDIGDSARLALGIMSGAIERETDPRALFHDGLGEVEIAAVAGKAIAMIQHAASDAKVAIETTTVARQRLIANGPALAQILLNLLQNAVKFTPTGGIVRLSVEPSSSGGLSISITDNGVGMSPSDTQILAGSEAMYDGRNESPGNGKPHGRRGIGFSLVRRLTCAMGATFRVESKRGIGTRVTVEFPPEALV